MTVKRKSSSKNKGASTENSTDHFEKAAKALEDALRNYRDEDRPEIFLDKLTRWTKQSDIGMFFYEREKWEQTDFSCVMGFTDPVLRDNCVLADQDMLVADFWRKRFKRKEKKDSPNKRIKASRGEEKCRIHDLAADDTPLKAEPEDPSEDSSKDSKEVIRARAMAALDAVDIAKTLIKSEGREIEKLPEYFNDLSSMMVWIQKVWQHDRYACQASAQMRFERNIHAIYFYRLKYTTQYLFTEGAFERRICRADTDRVRRYIRGGHRLIQLTAKHGLAVLLLVNVINAFSLGETVDEAEWSTKAKDVMKGGIMDAYNLVNAEFYKAECSWTEVPALEQISQWLFQPEFVSYSPYRNTDSSDDH
ncbi:hypothetical protein BJV82DRAFT_613040 [Fennellomyces sp. T-0311]|nr:hypothetical protein BJV82DRAFT_613040 [Fennellomyces sp. T-0311]